MSSSWLIRVYTHNALRFSTECVSPVELGRQHSGTGESLYQVSVLPERGSRVAVVPNTEATISRRLVWLEPVDAHRVRVRNLSTHVSFELEGGTRISPTQELDAVLPIVLNIGNTVVRIDPVERRTSLEMGMDDVEREKPGNDFRESRSSQGSLAEECEEIRCQLKTNHIQWDYAEQHGLIDEILKPASSARRMLGADFHKIVVLDAARGLGQGGLFDLLRFLAAVREEVVQTFGLRVDAQVFHIADIFQMLKDESPSLFCFPNFQLIPIEHMRTVRSFTQGVHRVLLLTRGSRNLARGGPRGGKNFGRSSSGTRF